MNALAIVAAGMPGATEQDVHDVLWEHTPFPCYRVTPRQLYRAASRVYRARVNKVALCLLCDRRKEEPTAWECVRCRTALDRINQR